MPIGRISGQLLKDNLLRDGVNLKFENDLIYLQVSNANSAFHKVGIKNSNPVYTLDINGTTNTTEFLTGKANVDDVEIDENIIRSTIGDLVIQAATPSDKIQVDNDVLINGNLHATGSITADGNLVLGSDDTDAIEFKADIVSDLIPNDDDTYNLGSVTKSWREIYVDDMRLGGPEIGTDNYNFTTGPTTNDGYVFQGLVDPLNYTKISSTSTDGHLALHANGVGLIELVSNSRVHENLRVEKDISTDNANFILIGEPEYGILDGAVEMEETTSLTDGVAQLNLVLTLLVPPAPPAFPNAQLLTINALTQRIINEPALSQPLNGNTITPVAPGTIVYVARVSSYSTSTITGTGPGAQGLLTVKRNTAVAVEKTLTFGNSTQVISTKMTGTTLGSELIKFVQPSAGVLVPGYLIKTDTSGAFGGLSNDTAYYITFVSAKAIKVSTYDLVTGTIGSPFVATSTDTGNLNFSTVTDNGVYSDNNTSLILTNNVASPLDTPGFHETVDISIAGDTVPAGWNTVEIIHSLTEGTSIGTTTSNTGIWYYDDSAVGSPVFTNQTFAIGTSSITYSSTIPHYNSSTTYNIGFDLAWNGGKTAHANTSTNILTTAAVGPWTSAGNKTYTNLGYTSLPATATVTSGSGPNSTTYVVNVRTGFGAWTTTSTVPQYTADNSYNTGTSALPPLNAIILYKTGTTSSTSFLDESNIFFNSAVGGSTTGATRCVNPDEGTANQDTPVFTAGSTLFNSQSGTFYDTDAVVVGTGNSINSLKHDITNYSTGYLPAGPNLSTRTAANSQYFTFRFTRSGVSKFSITYTTTTGVAAIFCAMPGTGGTSGTTSSLNKWLDLRIDNSLANGCALGGNMSPSATGTLTYNCSFGILSSTNSTNNEIWVRIKLNQGQSITSLYLGASTI